MKKYFYLIGLFAFLGVFKAPAQTLKALSYDISNNAVAFATNTNPITFRNPLAWATNSHREATISNLLPAYFGNSNGLLTLNSNATGLVWTANLSIAQGGTGATNATNARNNLGLGATNNVQFGTVSVLGSSNNYSTFLGGLDLKSDVRVWASGPLAGKISFVQGQGQAPPQVLGFVAHYGIFASEYNGALSFEENFFYDPDEFQFQFDGGLKFYNAISFGEQEFLTQSLSNMRLLEASVFFAAKDAANSYIASSFTGGGFVTGAYRDSLNATTNPSGVGFPFYRLTVPAANPRTNSDMAAIRSAWGSQPYFSGRFRNRIDWTERKFIFMRVAAPTAGGGTFQFIFGESSSPVFSTNVGGTLPVPSQPFIGFTLTRTNTPAQWTPQIISRRSADSSIITNAGSLFSASDLAQATSLLLEYQAGTNPAVFLYKIESSTGERQLMASQFYTNNPFVNSISNHWVNWVMGITPTTPSGSNTIGQMQYDIEPPLIIQ
jgi:hypothetical protein